MNMAFVSEREVVANCFPFNTVMTLKKPLTTYKGTFEAGTAVVAVQKRKGGYYIDLYSANGSDYFNLEDKINHSEKNTAKRSEEIRKFVEEYFDVDAEKTKVFDSKLNSLNPMLFATCSMLGFAAIILWIFLEGTLREMFDLSHTALIATAICAAILLFLYITFRKKLKRINRQCNIEDEDKVQKIISKI